MLDFPNDQLREYMSLLSSIRMVVILPFPIQEKKQINGLKVCANLEMLKV